MNIGALNKRITIQAYTTTTTENGFDEQNWIDYKTVWANVNNLWGKEFYAAKAVQEETTVEFIVRYSNDLEVLLVPNGTELYRICWRGKTYKIIFPDNIQYKNQWIKIKAKVI